MIKEKLEESSLAKESVRKKLKEGQDTKGVWWMPWYQEAKKDVASDEMLRGAASEPRSVDVRMGEPGRGEPLSSLPEYIG